MPRRPDVFIVGAAKSGTTSLHKYLQDHPQVYMSRVKEPGYFAPDVRFPTSERRLFFPDDEQRYLSLFSSARDQDRLGESSTTYLVSHRAPRLIHDFQPDARIIVMVRNPVDLIYSLHSERLSDGDEWIADFSSALAADAKRRDGELLPHDIGGRGVAYRDHALLGENLERWLQEFGPRCVHTIVFEDFANNTEYEFEKVLAFLGIDTQFKPESFAVHNASHRRRGGPFGALVRNPVTRWVSRTAAPAALGEERAAKLGRRFGIRRMGRRRYEREPLSADMRTRLEKEFADDVQKLGGLIGRDLKTEWFGTPA